MEWSKIKGTEEHPKVPFVAREIPRGGLIPKELEENLEKPVKVSNVRLFSRKKIVFGSLVAVTLILVFRSIAIQALLIASLFVICALSTTWKRKYPELPVGVELIIFGTATASIIFGPAFGIFFGIALAITAEIASGVIGEGVFFSIVAISLVAVAADFFRQLDFVILGILLTLLFDIITQAMPLLSDSEAKIKAAAFILTHVIFNFIVFKLLAPVVGLVV